MLCDEGPILPSFRISMSDRVISLSVEQPGYKLIDDFDCGGH
jgi:hypothetical protein